MLEQQLNTTTEHNISLETFVLSFFLFFFLSLYGLMRSKECVVHSVNPEGNANEIFGYWYP